MTEERDVELTTRMQIEWQCRNLCYEFAYLIDARQYSQLASLFADDGVFDRVGQMLRGRQAILEALRGRSSELRTRHVCHNIHFIEMTPDSARAVVYNTTLVGKGDAEGLPALYGMSQGVFLEFRDLYCRTSDGWRFRERKASVVMNPPDMPGH